MARIDQLAVEFGLTYFDADGVAHDIVVDREGVARPGSLAKELGLSVRKVVGTDITSWYVSVTPSAPVRFTSVEAQVIGVGLHKADALYLNGYNSWTDSVERPPIAAMRGLAGVPKRIVDQWVLDGSGDYRFAEQDARPGRQHGFGYGYVRKGDDVLLVGSLDEDSGFTFMREALMWDLFELKKEPPVDELRAGVPYELMSFAAAEGTLDQAVDSWLSRAGISALPAAPVVGFSSWYRHYEAIDQFKLARDLSEVHQLFEGRDVGNCRKVFQIDDGYTCVGDWTSPYTRRFPDGMEAMVESIRKADFVPGLWLAPFVCSVDSQLYREHPEWLLTDDAGQPVSTGSHWNGAYALDTLLPEVRAHVRASLSTAIHEWGFEFLKLDFLYGACMLPHGGMNRGQLMADALELIRETVGDDAVLDLCGVPMTSAFGRCEYCRIGCDVSLDWNDVPHMRFLHRERVSTKRSLANTRGRAHLDGRVFRCDPDVYFLRRDVKLTHAQREALIAADAALGGVFFTSDDVGSWDKGQLATFGLHLATFVERSKR